MDRLVSSASFLLLPFPSVKADLKIDARQEEPLAAALLAWGQRMSLLESLPPTERQARQQRVQSQTRRQVAAILTPRQKRRLYQIELQTAGAEALVRDEVNRALGLVWKQRVEIRSAIYGYETWGRELVKEIEGPDRDTDLLRDLQETKQKAYERAVAVLTDSQRVAWREMIGPRFDLHAVMIPAKLRESRPGPAWYFFFSPRSAPAPTNLKEETRDWVHEWLSPPSNMNPFLFFHRLIVDRIVSVHVSVMTTGDGRVLVSGKPTAVETFKAGLRVGDARVERLDDRTSRAVLSPEKARVDELRAALLSLPDAGTVVTRDHELVLEGRRAWVKQAVLAVVRAEMEAAQPPAAAPSPV